MEPNLYNNIPSGIPYLPKSNNTKKYVLVLIVVFVLAVAVFAFIKKDWLMSFVIKEKTEPVVVLPPAPKYTKTDLPVNKLPEVFPKDLIQEKDPLIITNYVAEKEDGTKSFTIQYFSKNTQQQIFKSYVDYFIKNKWGLLPDNKVTENLVYIFAISSEKKSIIYINSSYNEVSEMSMVDITLVQNK